MKLVLDEWIVREVIDTLQMARTTLLGITGLDSPQEVEKKSANETAITRRIDKAIDLIQQKQPECIYGRTLEEREKSCKWCSAICEARIEVDVNKHAITYAFLKCERCGKIVSEMYGEKFNNIPRNNDKYLAFLKQVELDDRFGELAGILQRYGAMPEPKEQPEVGLEKVCDAYCKVCGHYSHTTPTHICRQACDYFKKFEAELNRKEE